MTTAISLPLSRFYDREDRHPDKCFLVQPVAGGQVQKLSWSEVGNQARRAAHWLRRQGLPQGSCIAILSDNCAHWIITDLAIWMAGHVSVPLHPNLSPGSIAQVLEHSEAAMVFVGKLDDWPGISCGVSAGLPTVGLPYGSEGSFDFSWEDLQTWSPIQDNPTGRHDQLATIVYAPDFNGRPKGVMHSFGALAFAITHGSTIFGLGEKDRLLCYLPLCYVAERMFVEMASIYLGQTVFFTESKDTFVDDLKRARPTALFGVPGIWSKLQVDVYSKIPAARLDGLLSLPLLGKLVARRIRQRLGLDTLRVAVSGGTPVPENLLEWYQRLGLEVVEAYGMTENCGYSHICRPGQHKSGWIGQPCPQVEVRLAENGEVLVRSGATMLGYFKDSLKTAEAITPDGFLHTGDRGERDEQGYLRLTGRLQEIAGQRRPEKTSALAQAGGGER